MSDYRNKQTINKKSDNTGAKDILELLKNRPYAISEHGTFVGKQTHTQPKEINGERMSDVVERLLKIEKEKRQRNNFWSVIFVFVLFIFLGLLIIY